MKIKNNYTPKHTIVVNGRVILSKEDRAVVTIISNMLFGALIISCIVAAFQ